MRTEKDKRIRQRFEHRELPYRFLLEKEFFIREVLKDAVLYRIIDDLYAVEEEKNPYGKDEFAVEKREVTEEITLVSLSLPEPIDETDCVRIHMIYDKDFSHCGYYTVEKGMEEHWMGGWDAEVRFLYRPIVDYIENKETEEIRRALYSYGTQYPDYAETIEEAKEAIL